MFAQVADRILRYWLEQGSESVASAHAAKAIGERVFMVEKAMHWMQGMNIVVIQLSNQAYGDSGWVMYVISSASDVKQFLDRGGYVAASAASEAALAGQQEKQQLERQLLTLQIAELQKSVRRYRVGLLLAIGGILATLLTLAGPQLQKLFDPPQNSSSIKVIPEAYKK